MLPFITRHTISLPIYWYLGLLGICCLIACQAPESNCRTNIYGLYQGIYAFGGTLEMNLIEGAGDNGLFAIITNRNTQGDITYVATAKATLNPYCTILEIADQQLGTQYYAGTFSLLEAGLSGVLILNGTPVSVELTKQ